MNKQKPDVAQYPHRRKNILTGEWVLVSPHRMDRPWQGEVSSPPDETKKSYDPDCYLCPGNKRTNGEINPKYVDTFVFTNDYPALLADAPTGRMGEGLLQSRGEKGICRVVNFSPRHDLTLAEMNESEIEKVIACWQDEFRSLGADQRINYVQIFENKGSLMGNSNPHPHGQIWAQESIPGEPLKESRQFSRYYAKTKRSVLADYLKLEIKLRERIVFENESFVVLVPYWAVWPYETIIIPRNRIATILEFSKTEVRDFAAAISVTTVKYDNLFLTSFPYSAGLHQAPTDGKKHPEWHFHMHFYPPLLRSAGIRKFMVGYEMLAEPQRDVAPEFSAKQLRESSVVHFRHTNGTEARIK
jgi:UDPglucose--hexose-1-phosphate uridylyltransferase